MVDDDLDELAEKRAEELWELAEKGEQKLLELIEANEKRGINAPCASSDCAGCPFMGLGEKSHTAHCKGG